jgi:hypothetical protein
MCHWDWTAFLVQEKKDCEMYVDPLYQELTLGAAALVVVRAEFQAVLDDPYFDGPRSPPPPESLDGILPR